VFVITSSGYAGGGCGTTDAEDFFTSGSTIGILSYTSEIFISFSIYTLGDHMEGVVFLLKFVMIIAGYYVMISRKITKTMIGTLFLVTLGASLDRGAIALPLALVFTLTIGGFVKLAETKEGG